MPENEPELKTLIYEQPGRIGELKATALMNLILACARMQPELREIYESQKGENFNADK